MPSLFPIVLDSFLNPSSSTTLDASGSSPSLRHHIQHTNINDSMLAIQARIGVTGSSVSSSIDFELHNIYSGHDHDGINSRPIALGTSGSIPFSSGLFPFTVFTRAGDAISQINLALLQLSQSITASSLTTQVNNTTITTTTQLINITGSRGSIVSASVAGGTDVTYHLDALQHDTRALILLSDLGGPFERYLSGSYREITYTGNVFPLTTTWYNDSTKTKKIVEKIYSYNSNKTPNTIVIRVYEEDGTTVKATATDVITYSGGGVFEASRTRTIT